jgi:PAS domain S-box-containing protein
MKILAFSFFVAGLTNLFFAGVVFFKNRKRLSNRLFPFFSLNLVLWCFLVMAIVLCDSLIRAEFFVRLAFTAGAFLPANFFLFAVTLGGGQPARQMSKIKFFYFLAAVTAVLSFIPSFIEKTEPSLPSNIMSMPGPEVIYNKGLFSLYIVSVIAVMGYALFHIYGKSKHVSGMQKLEIQYVFLGVLVGTIFTMMTSLFPSLFGTTVPSRFAPFSSVIMVGFIAYAIAKYKIMDITLVFEFTLMYTFLSFILFFLYLLVVYAATEILNIFHISESLYFLPAILGAFLVAVGFIPAKNRLQGFLRKKFFRWRYDREEVLFETFSNLLSLREISAVFNNLGRILSGNLGVPEKFLLLLNKDYPEETFLHLKTDVLKIESGENSEILKYLMKRKGVMIKEEMERFSHINNENEKIPSELEKKGYEVVVPIMGKENLIGGLLVQKKTSGAVFNEIDILLLKNIGLQLGITLENMILYNRLSRANIYRESLLTNSPCGVISLDEEGRITIFNNEAEELTGKNGQKAIGKLYHAVLPEQIAEKVKETFKNKKEIKNVELTLLARDGQKKEINLNTSTFSDLTGVLLGVQIIISDITQIKQLEEEVRRADRLASLGVMAAGIAHEIKNPLVSIRTFIQLLPQRYNEKEFRENFAALTKKEVERINNLVEQILLFAKPRVAFFKPVNIIDIIKSTLLLFSAQLTDKEIKIKAYYSADDIIIRGDEEKLKQAFLNIFLNSREAIVSNGVISINVIREEGKVKVSVKDSGCGIKRDVIDKIFEPFFTTKEKGTGLGLSIVTRIVDEHNGRIRIDSEKGKGTEVYIELPEIKEKKEN